MQSFISLIDAMENERIETMDKFFSHKNSGSQAKINEPLINDMRNNPKNIKFRDLSTLCENLFGKPRIKGSHEIFNTPLCGDPRINIQNKNGMAKPYQVKQVLSAIDRLQEFKELDT